MFGAFPRDESLFGGTFGGRGRSCARKLPRAILKTGEFRPKRPYFSIFGQRCHRKLRVLLLTQFWHYAPKLSIKTNKIRTKLPYFCTFELQCCCKNCSLPLAHLRKCFYAMDYNSLLCTFLGPDVFVLTEVVRFSV